MSTTLPVYEVGRPSTHGGSVTYTHDISVYRLRLYGLMQACAAMTETSALSEALDTILIQASKAVDADAGSLYIVRDQHLLFAASINHTFRRREVQQTVPWTPPLGDRLELSRGSIAGYVALTGQVLNIDDCYALPPQVPYRFNASADLRSGYRTQSMLSLPLRDRSGDIVGVLQMINRLDSMRQIKPFADDDVEILQSLSSVAAVSIRNAELVEQLKQAHHDTIVRLSMAAESRDSDTGLHIKRMSLYSQMLARAAGMSGTECELVLNSSTMHDIGKLAIADAILKKPAALTEDERREMQQHTVYGARILEGSDNPTLQMGQVICLTHHERWDGRGYPNGLKGESIPLVGRVAAIADVFDAMSSKRCYHAAKPFDQVLDLVRENAGKAFDPGMVKLFLDHEPDARQIYDTHRDD